MNHANDNTPRPASFDALLAKYEPFLRSQCRRLCPTDHEDAYQETVCRALAQWANYRPDGHFPTWLNFFARKVQTSNRQREFKLPYIPATVAPATQEDRLAVKQALAACGKGADLVAARATGCTLAEMAAKARVCTKTMSVRVREARTMVAGNNNERKVEAA